jgi:tetratricopeptide (TPR) repeat protein
MVTTMFIDLVDSTALASRLGPERAEELRKVYYRALRAAVADTGGTEVKSTGDGLHAVFQSVSKALGCAVAIQQAIDRHNQGAGEPLGVRVGLSHGEAEPAEDGDYYGASVVEAARLCAKAGGGEIVTTELVRVLAGGRGGHEFEAIGALELKGLGEVPACRVLWKPARGPGWSVPVPARLRGAGGAWFVGRNRELAGLVEGLKASASDSGRRVVLVGGEAGIGKTSLVSRLAGQALDSGVIVLYGRCDEELGIPYQPWSEALAQLVEHAPETLLQQHVEARGGDLATLVPGLAARLGRVPPARSSDPETERHLLFGAVLDLVDRVSREAPVLLVLDDLHWADRPTLQLLRHVVVGSLAMRLMLLGTFRAAGVGADDPLAELLAALHREPGVERVNLVGLDDLELLSLLETAAGHEVTADMVALRDVLGAETDGNPFFVIEILRHLAETGAIARSEGLWIANMDLRAQGLPVSVREVIGRRVHRLGNEASRVLGAASVIGRDFDAALLSDVTDVEEDDVLDILDRARAATVVADAAGQRGAFTFVHALIQHALYDDLSTARRQRLHRRVAEALEALPGDPDDRVGELAQHWYAATQPADVEKAFRYSIAAGDRANHRLAPDEAVRWYTQALELLDERETSDRGSRRCDLLLRLGVAQRLAGSAAFRDTLLEVAHLAQADGDTDRLIEAALANSRGFASFVGNLDEERIAILQAALDALGSRSPELRARLLAQWAAEATFGPEYDADVLIEEALTLTEHSDDPQARWHALQALYLNFVPRNLATRLACRDEYFGLLDRVDLQQQATIHMGWFAAAVQSVDIDEVRRDALQMDASSHALGDPVQIWLAAWADAGLQILSGDLETGQQRADAALQIALDNEQPDAFVIYGAQLINLRMMQGREAEICDLVAQTAADNPGVPAFRAAHAALLASSGRLEEARRELGRFTTDSPDLWADPIGPYSLALWADAAGRTRHRLAARRIIPLLGPFADQWIWSGASEHGPVALSMGLLFAVLNSPDKATECFAQALQMADKMASPYSLARTQVEWAVMLLEQGNRDEAQTRLLQAADIARKHGFRGLETRTDALTTASTL